MEIAKKEFKNYPENVRKKINTSINLITLYEYYQDDYFDDWSFLIFPIVVGLEGYIKWLLIKLDVKVDKRINYFEMESGRFKLRKDLNYNKSKKDIIKIVEDCYNVYIQHRHDLCHYEIGNKYDNSFIIENKSKAIQIFNEIYLCFKEEKQWKNI